MKLRKLFSVRIKGELALSPAIVVFVFLFLHRTVSAVEKEDPKALPPPEIKVIFPFGIIAGETNQIKVRGLNFTNISMVKVTGASNVVTSFKQPVKSDPPKGTDKDDSGDMVMETSLFVPSQSLTNDLQVTLSSTLGDSKQASILLLNKETLVLEKEANGGFTKAQSVNAGQTVMGSIENANDVDVFSFEAVKGDKITVQILGRTYGSTLDSLVSIFDSNKHVVASSDDAKGRDSAVAFEAKSEGRHFISVMDASDTGSPLHLYYLQLLQTAK